MTTAGVADTEVVVAAATAAMTPTATVATNATTTDGMKTAVALSAVALSVVALSAAAAKSVPAAAAAVVAAVVAAVAAMNVAIAKSDATKIEVMAATTTAATSAVTVRKATGAIDMLDVKTVIATVLAAVPPADMSVASAMSAEASVMLPDPESLPVVLLLVVPLVMASLLLDPRRATPMEVRATECRITSTR